MQFYIHGWDEVAPETSLYRCSFSYENKPHLFIFTDRSGLFEKLVSSVQHMSTKFMSNWGYRERNYCLYLKAKMRKHLIKSKPNESSNEATDHTSKEAYCVLSHAVHCKLEVQSRLLYASSLFKVWIMYIATSQIEGLKVVMCSLSVSIHFAITGWYSQSEIFFY